MMWFIEMSSALMIFLSLSFLGVFFIVFSMSLLGVWFGLECNFFGFIPVLNGKSSEESESAMKYFIVQGVGSGALFLGVICLVGDFFSMSNGVNVLVGMLCFVLGGLIKIGIFPFHFWFPSVMGSSSWFNCFMLSTWQKMGMFYCFSGMGLSNVAMMLALFMGMMTSMVGGVGGVGQIYLRSILSYSSLVHSGWMMFISLISVKMFIIYFLLYVFILFFFFKSLNKLYCFSLVKFSSNFSMKKSQDWIMVLMFLLSLGGLPPMLGASLKLMGIICLFKYFLIMMMVLILSSLISLFYYLMVFYSSSLYYQHMYFIFSMYKEGKFKKFNTSGQLLSGFHLFLGLISFISVTLISVL